LRFGHGDAWQRARVFILAARQADLDAVMLAVDDRGPGSRPNLWCPAVLIDGELYLFDTSLGLALPSAEAGKIATLSEARANPDLLRQWDVEHDGETLTYPIAAGQLQRIAVLVDAASETLTQRMQMLEARLTGENTLVLAVSPSRLAKTVRACPGLEDVAVRLWTLPFETQVYRQALDRLARRDPAIQRRRVQEQGMYLPAVEHARLLHLLGRLETQEEKPGALKEYMESRVTNDRLDRMVALAAAQLGIDPLDPARNEKMAQAMAGGAAAAPAAALARMPAKDIEEVERWGEVRDRIGLAPLRSGLSTEQRQFALALELAQYRHLNKQHASYWIGLAQYDVGQYAAAVAWLKERTLDAFPQGVWTAGARYNLARTYEALDRIQDARKLYYQSESPQRHGDLLRARILRGE
jgi:tetratricopeptide (TPR) repeat protein